MKKYRFHHLGLVHLPLSREYMSCAFTQKLVKLNQMLLDQGHEIFYYGCRSNNWSPEEYYNSDNFHFVETHDLFDIRNDYGVGDNRFEVGYDWTNTDFKHDFNAERKQSTLKFYNNCIDKINKVKKPDDFLLCTQGYYHKPISDKVNLFLTCEPGIGYRGSVRGRFRAFESSYIQNFTYGSEYPFECINGSYYDRVIPNYFEPDEVEFSNEKDDFYFFIGRMIKRKGILTADLVCRHLGKKLIIAGQGAHVDEYGRLVPNEDPDFILDPGTWEYVGFVNTEQRKEYMSRAIATFTPTEYLECFAGTHVESMLHGTPPITTNFAVFPGTIPDHLNGIVGFRCNTLDDFVDAAIRSEYIDHYKVREYGERFLTTNVKYEFQKWFDDLHQVYLSTDGKTKGWSYIKER